MSLVWSVTRKASTARLPSSTTQYVENVYSFVNNVNTVEGGTHLSGFRAGLTRTINDYARKAGLLKENEEALSGEDVREV